MTIRFSGKEVDPWIDDIDFQADVCRGHITVRVVPEHKEQFKNYDQDMWLEWAHQYAQEAFVQKEGP